MKKIFLGLFLCCLCCSCASSTYANEVLLRGQLDIALEEAKADTERVKALGKISQSSDNATSIVAALALGNFGQSAQKTQIRMPKSGWDTAREWVGMFLGPITQMYGMKINGDVAMNGSDNNREVSISTNESFVGIANKIQAPAANLTIGGSGVIGEGTFFTSTDTHDITESYNPINEQNPVDNRTNYDNLVDNTTTTN